MKVGTPELLRQGESRTVEFKSTGRLNLHTKSKDSRIEWAIVKTVCGFLNAADGGVLLVGVGDEGEVVGIELDASTLPMRRGRGTEQQAISPTALQDKWQQWFFGLVREKLGGDVAAKVPIEFERRDGKTIARIDVLPGSQPTYARAKDRQVFYVRQGSTTSELEGRALQRYLAERFPEAGPAEAPRRRFRRWVVALAALTFVVLIAVLVQLLGGNGGVADVPADGNDLEPTLPPDRTRGTPEIYVDDVDRYRRRFSPARSGNGWTRTVTVDGWGVTLWVGRRGDETAAAAFAPRRRQRSGEWAESASEPLADATHLDEDTAFAWLLDLEENGEIRREARRSIAAYERLAERDADGEVLLSEPTQEDIRGGSEDPVSGANRQRPSAADIDSEVALYRRDFDDAQSGNGWTRNLDLTDGWRVRLWVGTRGGKPYAAVFAPSRREQGRWVETQDEALMEAEQGDYDAAFLWLRQQEESGAITTEARRSIEAAARSGR